jgi:hypothetical protein
MFSRKCLISVNGLLPPDREADSRASSVDSTLLWPFATSVPRQTVG